MHTARDEFRFLGVRLYENRLESGNFALHAASNLLHLPIVAHRIRRFRPDVVHVHDAFCYGLFALTAGLPYMLTPWGSDLLVVTPKNRLFNAYARRTVSRAACILYDGGEHMHRRLLDLGGTESRMRVFAFGVDVRRFAPMQRSDAVRAEFGVGADAHLVVSTRSLTPLYDIGTYLRAAALVLSSAPETRFLVVGDGPERPRLEGLARELGIADRVTFLGRVDENRMAACVASADVYVSTSTSDAGIAASTAEAMACGVPAVITDFGDNARWVRDGENGFLFPIGDHETLARHILRLVRERALREHCGAANVRRIVADNNYYVEMAKVAELYRSVFGLR